MREIKKFIMVIMAVCMIGIMAGCGETTATSSVGEDDSSESVEIDDADNDNIIITADGYNFDDWYESGYSGKRTVYFKLTVPMNDGTFLSEISTVLKIYPYLSGYDIMTNITMDDEHVTDWEWVDFDWVSDDIEPRTMLCRATFKENTKDTPGDNAYFDISDVEVLASYDYAYLDFDEDFNPVFNEYTFSYDDSVGMNEDIAESEIDIYGFYSFSDAQAEMNAEVDYSTSEDADYIRINGYWYLEDCNISFEGYMSKGEENVYYAENEDCGLIIVFDENGMQVDVEWSEFESSEIMQGYYTKTVSADWGDSGAGSIDYLQAYGTIVDNVNASIDYAYYHICDIDGDGLYELITEYGESSADYVNDIWTVDANGYAVYVGSVYGELSFYIAPDYDGIYAVYGHMDYEIISRITIQDGELFEEIVSEGEVENDYYSNDMPIMGYSTSDISYLSGF